jgi:hypothetical protein
VKDASRDRQRVLAHADSAADGYSRLAYSEALPDEKAVTAVAFLGRAQMWFAAHGIAHIERIVTDNGACYRAKVFRVAMNGEPGIGGSRPTRQHNGKWSATTRFSRKSSSTPAPGIHKPNAGTALEVCNRHYNYHPPTITRRTVHTTDNRQHPRRRYPSAMSLPHTLS